jgi:hypothetical protein
MSHMKLGSKICLLYQQPLVIRTMSDEHGALAELFLTRKNQSNPKSKCPSATGPS